MTEENNRPRFPWEHDDENQPALPKESAPAEQAPPQSTVPAAPPQFFPPTQAYTLPASAAFGPPAGRNNAAAETGGEPTQAMHFPRPDQQRDATEGQGEPTRAMRVPTPGQGRAANESENEPTRAMYFPQPRTGSAPPRPAAKHAEDPTQILPTERPTGTSDAVDTLFAASSFQQYDDKLIPENQPAESSSGLSPKTAKTLIWVGFGVLGVLLLTVLFLVGQRIPEWLDAGAETTAELPAEATLPPGQYAYSDLRGGECLSPYENSWQAKYTVVDCADEHEAQLLAVVAIDDGALPSEHDLEATLQEHCPPATLIDFAAAESYSGLRLSGSYPITEGQWRDDERSYFCFASVQEGDTMTNSVLAGGNADADKATEEPTEDETAK